MTLNDTYHLTQLVSVTAYIENGDTPTLSGKNDGYGPVNFRDVQIVHKFAGC